MSNGQFAEKVTVTDNGVEFNGFRMEPIVENCKGCERIATVQGQEYCTSYPMPSGKWRHGACNFATHVKASVDKSGEVKLNPIKASKRAARKK